MCSLPGGKGLDDFSDLPIRAKKLEPINSDKLSKAPASLLPILRLSDRWIRIARFVWMKDVLPATKYLLQFYFILN